MVRARDQANRLPDRGARADPRILGRMIDEPDVAAIVRYCTDHLARAREFQRNRQPWMPAPELAERAAHEICDKAFTKHEVDVTAMQPLELPQAGQRVVAIHRVPAVVLDQELARLGRAHPAAVPVE